MKGWIVKIKVFPFGAVRVVVPVTVNSQKVGELRRTDTTGWRGGPTYIFHPNDYGIARGLYAFHHKTISRVKEAIRRQFPDYDKGVN